MSTTIVLNPTAGRGRAAREWKKVRDELRDWPDTPTVVETQREGHGAEIARDAVAAGVGLVIAAGGDGTAHEVVQGLMEAGASAAGTAFSHLPLGTGCDLARSLGLPLRPDGILRGLSEGSTSRIDVGVVEMRRDAATVRRYFLNAATVGLGPAVARRVKGSPALQRLGKNAYKVASIEKIVRAAAYPISWRADDDRDHTGQVLHMFINNGPSVAGGMRPSPEASLTSGRLHVVVVAKLGLFAALYQFHRMDRRRPFTSPDIQTFSCRSLDLEGSGLDVETDGEIAGGLPARFAVQPAGLEVRLPG